MIQAAGHHRAVGKDADLVAQAEAKLRAPLPDPARSGQENCSSSSKNRFSPSTRLRLRVLGSSMGFTPIFSCKKRRISSFRLCAPPPFHSRRAQCTPFLRTAAQKSQTAAR